MKNDLINRVFSEFCESKTHLDSLLARVEPTQKSRVAIVLGAFLRRPLTLAKHFGIELEVPEEFWKLSFIRMRKHTGVHQVLEETWKHYRLYHELPQEGSVIDFPTTLIEEWSNDWGAAATESFARSLSQDPLTTVRLHRRAFADEARLIDELKKADLPKMREGYYSPFARIFKGFARVQTIPVFKEGFYEIQDEGSQVMSLFSILPEEMSSRLSATPTVKRTVFEKTNFEELNRTHALQVVDACAGAGGKTLALADFLKGQGRVYGYDVHEKKIQALKKRAERAQERNIQGVVLPRDAEGLKTALKKFKNNADRVLVDSPCTGTGVLRRNPDIKWPRKPLAKEYAFERSIEDLQKKVVTDYLPLAKTGGIFTYGVCSFARTETLDMHEWIQKTHPQLEPIASGFIGPHEADGFYMSAFRVR